MGPIADEIAPEVAAIFAPETIVAAVPQGWMRRWDADGRVHSKRWESAEAILPHLDVLVVSLEDFDADWARLAPVFHLCADGRGDRIQGRQLGVSEAAQRIGAGDQDSAAAGQSRSIRPGPATPLPRPS